MSYVDAVVQQFIQKWILPLVLAGTTLMIVRKYGRMLRDRILAAFWNRKMDNYHNSVRAIKEEHFRSMNYLKSADQNLRNKGLLRILEIGAGSGANFEFFPPNSRLIVVEPNAYFEPFFYERVEKHRNVKMEKFILGCAEDMKGVESNSVDVVVSTLVLCSVEDLNKTFKEVQRVLAPGGKFFYWEHVHDSPGSWLHTIQNLLTWFIWAPICGCYLNRDTDHVIAEDKGFSHVEQKRFHIPMTTAIHRLIRVHVMGVATK